MIRFHWPWRHRDRAGIAEAREHLEATRRDWDAVNRLVHDLTQRAEKNHFAAGMREALRGDRR